MGADMFINVTTGSTVTLPLRGTKWDHATPTTSATASDGVDLQNTNGVAVDTTGATAAGVTCPAGHIQ